jgi:hypothetical protein
MLDWFFQLTHYQHIYYKNMTIIKMLKEKKDSSETLRTTDSMKRRAHLCSRFLITLMKLFRLLKCGKRKRKGDSQKIQKNTA